MVVTLDYYSKCDISIIAPPQVTQLLLGAAASGNSLKLEKLCETWSGHSVINTVDDSSEGQQMTPLMLAVKSGSVACVELLCRAHAALNATCKTGASALHISAQEGKEDILHYLIDVGCDFDLPNSKGATPCNAAAASGRAKCLRLLIDCHANLNTPNSSGYTPIGNAAEGGKDECVSMLLEAGVDMNRGSNNRYTPVCVAALWGRDVSLGILLKAGADYKIACNTGATPAYLASQNGKEKCLQLLLDYGADVNALRTDGNSPTYAAALKNRESTLKMLINCGKADINKANQTGETPLYAAANAGHLKCVELLVAAGAELNTKERDGWTALSAAQCEKHFECVEVLAAAGARDFGPPVYEMDDFFSADESFKREQQDESSVDEMKIQTMYKMVDECRVAVQGREVTKKVLYLTNKQALLFDESAMGRCVQALDLGEPKFVIKLLPSLGVHSQMRTAHPELYGLPQAEYGTSFATSSEISRGDERAVETQVLLFMKTCILPLAVQTRALILVSGHNDCYLSVALASVALAEQARLGKDCPFTVVATASEREVHSRAVSPEDQHSVAAQILRGSRAWLKRIQHMNDFYSRKYLRTGTKMVRCDLTASASRFIVFEDFDEGSGSGDLGSINASPRRAFESVFLQYLTRKLPSIAVQAFGIGEGMPFIVDLLSRNIPVLLLDATERAISAKRTPNSSNNSGVGEGGDGVIGVTTLSKETKGFPSIPVEAVMRLKKEGGQLTLQSRHEIMSWAEKMMENKWHVLKKHGVTDCFNASLLAFAHSALNLGVAINSGGSSTTATGQIVPLHARIRELEKFERTNKESTNHAAVPTELLSRMMDFLYNRNLVLFKNAQLAKVEKWIAKHDSNVEHLMSQATAYHRDLKAECAKIAENDGQLLESEDMVREVWLAEYDTLSSGNTFSGSLFDIDGIKQILASVAKIDRLPSSNSLSALRALQDAWDYVEIYHAVADGYKRVTKVSYISLLIIGILVTALAVTGEEFSQKFSARIPIICLSFLGSIVGSFVSFRNPAVKWQQLRIAALALESEIWMFRTRSGAYRSNSGESFDDSAERRLCDAVDAIKSTVLEGADVKNTPFYSQSSSYNLHGQHVNTAGGFGLFDDYTESIDAAAFNTEAAAARAAAATAVAGNNDNNNKGMGDVGLDDDDGSNLDDYSLTPSAMSSPSRKRHNSSKNSSSRSSFGGPSSPSSSDHPSIRPRRKSLFSQLQQRAESTKDFANVPLGEEEENDLELGSPSAGAGAGASAERASQGADAGIGYDEIHLTGQYLSGSNNGSPNTTSNPISSKNKAVLARQQQQGKKGTQAASAANAGTVAARASSIHSSSLLFGESQGGAIPLMDVIHSLTPNLDGEGDHPVDSHYEPVQPDQYIRFRVQAALQFYKARIPICNRTRTYSQLCLVLGSVAAGILAYANVTIYAAIVSITTGAITAYLEFVGTNSKISRYSFTVHALQQLIMWWQTLPPIDKSVVANVDRLVVTCEELLQREQQSWKATSQAVRLLQKESSSASGGNSNNDD